MSLGDISILGRSTKNQSIQCFKLLMLVSNSQEFLFLHIPKTAGTSVAKSLAQSLKWNDLVIGGTKFGELVQPHYKENFGLSKHSSAREIKSVLGDKIWDKYLKFAFVRHPYSRAISLYTYVQKLIQVKGSKGRLYFFLGKTRVQSWHIVQAYLETKSFSDFIRHDKFKKTFVTASQTEYLIDEKGEINFDFVGKFETLKKDFSVVSGRIGLPNLTLAKSNVSPTSGKLKKAYLYETDYTYLSKIYEQDFENFSYDRDRRI